MMKHVETCDKYLLHKQREDKFKHSQNKIVENKNIEKREPTYTIR